MKIKLQTIRSKSPCKHGWEKLLKSLPSQDMENEVTIDHVLESNGIEDTLWLIINTIDGEKQKKREMLADIAESVLHIYEKEYPSDKRVRECIETIRNIKITKEELKYSYDAAYSAYAAAANAADVAYAAYNSIYHPANAASFAAYSAYAASNAYAAVDAAADAYAYAAVDAAADAYAYAAVDANSANAAAAYDNACEKEREKQKKIVLKYFGEKE